MPYYEAGAEPCLSDREKEVIVLWTADLTTREIGGSLQSAFLLNKSPPFRRA
jgi:hypothetical protein